MTKTLDRSQPHGTIHPPYEGAHFSQGGYYFDAAGRLVEALLTPETKAALAKKAAPRPPQPPTGGAAETKPPETGGGEGDGQPKGEEDDGVNLEQWLRDDASANFLDVRKAVKKRYSVWETTKAGVVIFLVNEIKLLSADELDADLRKLLPAGQG